MLYKITKFFLFLLPPEFSHNFSLYILKFLNFLNLVRRVDVPEESSFKFKDINFKNKIGLAAGFDKNAEFIDLFQNLGFGFIEIGTVTPKPQSGNAKPRVHRDIKKEALINSFGFNNVGVERFIENVKKVNRRAVIGINIGKNALTPYDNSIDDYVFCMRKVYEYADYLTINISSPNTKNLRNLHDINQLSTFLNAINQERKLLEDSTKKLIPFFVKLSPDINDSDINPIINLLITKKIDGVILTNTTIDKNLVSNKYKNLPGGISGSPLRRRSEFLLSEVKKIAKDNLIIISVGGIMSVEDAKKRINLGADLIQIYSALIYKGPNIVNEIRRSI
jgi:dihydroorotate dehydrogenase